MTACQCLMVRTHDGRDRFDMCGSSTTGRDYPMCEDCRRHGHDLSPDQVPLSDPRRRHFAGVLLGTGIRS